MQALLDRYVQIDTLCSIAHVTSGRRPTDVFSGDRLTVSMARDIAECMHLPGVGEERFIACSYFEVTYKSFDVLLMPLEDYDCHFVFSSETTPPDTFKSRLSLLSSGAPSLSVLYMALAEAASNAASGNRSFDVTMIDPASLEFWRNRYMQSLGSVSQYVASVADGNHEAALRASLNMRSEDLELLAVDLEWQLTGRSICGVSLSRVPVESILSACNIVTSKSQSSVSTKAASAALLLCQ